MSAKNNGHALRKHDNRLTDEEKAHWAPMLHATWQAIGPDCHKAIPALKRSDIIELVCDANMPETYGGMTSEEYRVLSRAYSHTDTQKWLRATLNY